MKKTKEIMWGIVLIVLGIIIGLNTLEIANINLFFKGWWTLLIIIPSFIRIFSDNEKTGSIIGLLIGISLLLACQNIITFEIIWKLSVPVILIIIGLSLITRDILNNKTKEIIKNMKNNKNDFYNVTFDNKNIEIYNEEFNGCEIDAVFGGLKLDLRNAIIKDDVVIKTSAIFSGIDIYVGDNVNVKVSSTSIFGGSDNKHKIKEDSSKKTIYISATNVFGGINIK